MSTCVPNFSIGPMRFDEYDQCVDIAAAAFTINNPMVVHLGIPRELYKRLVVSDTPLKATVHSGLSLVARSEDDGKPLAFLFMKVADFNELPADDIFDLHAGFQVTKDALEQLYDKALMAPLTGLCLGSVNAGKTLHCLMGGTFPDVDGTGLGKALRIHAIAHARARGFNTLLVEPCHGSSLHIWTAYCGGVVKAQIAWDAFRMKKPGALGEFPLRGVAGGLAIVEVVLARSFWDATVFWPYYAYTLLAEYEASAAERKQKRAAQLALQSTVAQKAPL